MHSHKEWVRDTFDLAAPRYGEKSCTFFDYFGRQLVAHAQLKKGDCVLDVASGKGAVLLPAAEVAGKVIGIDISARMIQEAKKRVPRGVDLFQMDAEHIQFPSASFDVVFCAFALFFFPNLQAALAEFKRVLKPGGLLAVSVWGKRAPLDQWVAERVKEMGVTRRLGTIELDTVDRLKEQLGDVEIREEKKEFRFANTSEWWESLLTHGTRAQLDQLPPEKWEQLKQEALQKVKGEVIQEKHVIFGLVSSAQR